MIKKNEILEILEENRKDIRLFGVKRIGVFGSFVRGASTTKSDIDILIEFHPGKKTFDHYMDLKVFLEKKFHRKVDLVVQEALKPRVRSSILKEIRYAGL